MTSVYRDAPGRWATCAIVCNSCERRSRADRSRSSSPPSCSPSVGDWAARVALAVLVLEQTDSPGLTRSRRHGQRAAVDRHRPGARDARRPAAAQAADDRVRPDPRRRVHGDGHPDADRRAASCSRSSPALPTPPFAAARAALLPETVPAHQYPDALALATIIAQSDAGARLPDRRRPRRGDRPAGRARRQLRCRSSSRRWRLSRLKVGRTRTAKSNRIRCARERRAIWNDVMVRRAVAVPHERQPRSDHPRVARGGLRAEAPRLHRHHRRRPRRGDRSSARS